MRIYLRLLVVSLLLFVGNIVYAEAQQERTRDRHGDF